MQRHSIDPPGDGLLTGVSHWAKKHDFLYQLLWRESVYHHHTLQQRCSSNFGRSWIREEENFLFRRKCTYLTYLYTCIVNWNHFMRIIFPSLVFAILFMTTVMVGGGARIHEKSPSLDYRKKYTHAKIYCILPPRKWNCVRFVVIPKWQTASCQTRKTHHCEEEKILCGKSWWW